MRPVRVPAADLEQPAPKKACARGPSPGKERAAPREAARAAGI